MHECITRSTYLHLQQQKRLQAQTHIDQEASHASGQKVAPSFTCVNYFTIPRLLPGLDLPVPGLGVLLQGAEDEGLPVLPRGGAMGGAHGFHRDNLNIESLSQAGVTITDLVALAEHHRFDWTKIGASEPAVLSIILLCADIVSWRVCIKGSIINADPWDCWKAYEMHCQQGKACQWLWVSCTDVVLKALKPALSWINLYSIGMSLTYSGTERRPDEPEQARQDDQAARTVHVPSDLHDVKVRPHPCFFVPR